MKEHCHLEIILFKKIKTLISKKFVEYFLCFYWEFY